MLNRIIYLVLFCAGIAMGYTVGSWGSRKLSLAFEDLKRTSAQVEQARQDLEVSLAKAKDELSAKLRLEQEKAQQSLADYKSTHDSLLSKKEAQIRALKAGAAAASSPAEAAKINTEIKGLECLDVPVPAPLIQGLNKVSK